MRSPVRVAKTVARQALAWKGRAIVRPTSLLGRKLLIDVLDPKGPSDYVRLAALEQCAHEIALRSISGAVAELGVYRGEFAVRINQAFRERTLYLFDTFEGFDTTQEERERRERGLTHVRDFSDTTAEFVLSRMPHPERCIIRKGLFPETVDGLEEMFVFVSIDADLFEPIYEGLQYFYPRLQAGGYIFVNDYNNTHFPGAHQAVERFSQERGILLVPLPDAQGSVIIPK